ncbi:hypothetical protein M2321_001401 [Rhodoblastus acidophilus]|nr:hypothetical protein [Rhodoblastus acidophilus]
MFHVEHNENKVLAFVKPRLFVFTFYKNAVLVCGLFACEGHASLV